MIFISVVVIFLILTVSVITRKNYKNVIIKLDKHDYPLREFLGFGLYVLDITGLHKMATAYTNRLKSLYGQLYGRGQSNLFVKLHYANIILYVAIGEAVVNLINISTDYALSFFYILIPPIIIVGADFDLRKRVKKRIFLIQLYLPDFINTLALLVNAGMSVRRCWEKIASDNTIHGPLNDEIQAVAVDIKTGKSELKAYEDFALRCRIPETSRFISMLAMNLRKGSSQLVSVLRISANDSWTMRKNVAKRLGEEASTKLVFPLMLMFVAIVMIVATPAVLALSNI